MNWNQEIRELENFLNFLAKEITRLLLNLILNRIRP